MKRGRGLSSCELSEQGLHIRATLATCLILLVLFCFVVVWFFKMGFVYSPGCPGTPSVDQAGLELTGICLPLPLECQDSRCASPLAGLLCCCICYFSVVGMSVCGYVHMNAGIFREALTSRGADVTALVSCQCRCWGQACILCQNRAHLIPVFIFNGRPRTIVAVSCICRGV